MEANETFLGELEDPLLVYEENTADRIYRFLMEYFLSIVHILICVFIVLSSCLVFFVIYKFKRLRTNTNMMLVNFFACLVLNSIFLASLTILSSYGMSSLRFGFLVYLVTLDASLILAALLALDWFLLANYSNNFINRYYKLFLLGTYAFSSMNWLRLVLSSFFDHYLLLDAVFSYKCIGVFVLSGLIIAVINIIKSRKVYSQDALKTLYSLKAASYYFIFWLPFVIVTLLFILLSNMTSIGFTPIMVMAFFLYLMEFVGYSAPIYLVVSLGKNDKNFQMGYDYVFKRSVRKYARNHDQEDLDLEGL